MIIDGLAGGVRAFANELARYDSGIAVNGNLHILIVHTLPFDSFVRQHGRLGVQLAVTVGVYELLGEYRGNQIGIIGPLRLQPLIFERGDRRLGAAAGLLSLRGGDSRQ